MKWMRTTKGLGAIAALSVVLAYGSTKVRDMVITNSTMDSTPIGATTPSGGVFTSTRVTSNGTVSGQGASTQWNIGNGGFNGETDFINGRGLGAGGFAWYNTTSTSPGTPIAKLDASGNFTASALNGTLNGNASGAQLSYLQIAVTSNYGSSPISTQGGYLGFNQQTVSGEMDFVDQRGGGAGGFNWYVTSGAALSNPILKMDAVGNLSLQGTANLYLPNALVASGLITTTGNITTTGSGSITAANGFNGSLNGNASTAHAFDHNPSNCGANSGLNGIDQFGNTSGCTHIATIRSTTTNSCTTGSSSYSSCTVTGNWSSPFPSGTPHVTCTLLSTSDNRGYIGAMPTINATGVQVNIVTGGAVAVTGSAECIGVVD